MRTYLKHVRHNRRGMTLLIMIVLLAAFLSIAMGMINILLGQLFVIGQAGESFRALYAADIGMERALYRDRVQNICSGTSCDESKIFSNGSCYTAHVIVGPSEGCLAPNTRCLDVSGQSVCVPARRYVERAFDIKY